LGLVLLESLTRTRAFPGPLMESISARLVGDPPIPGSVGPGWASLLSAMTARAAEARPSALDVAVAARALERDLLGTDVVASEDRVGAELATEVAAAAPTTLTIPMDAHAAGSTAIMPTAVAEQLDRDAVARAADRTKPTGSPGTNRTSRRRRRLVGAAVGLLVVVAAVVVVPRVVAPSANDAPTLPAVVEPLGTDLQALMRSVSP
jgi:hypothetical protein